MLLALSLACWRPTPSAPVELAPLPEPNASEVEDATDSAAPTEDVAPAAVDVASDPTAVTPWNAVTSGAPCTLVDGYGKPVAVLNRMGTPLRVVSEDALRYGVECDVCVPKTQGYVQRTLLEKSP